MLVSFLCSFPPLVLKNLNISSALSIIIKVFLIYIFVFGLLTTIFTLAIYSHNTHKKTYIHSPKSITFLDNSIIVTLEDKEVVFEHLNVTNTKKWRLEINNRMPYIVLSIGEYEFLSSNNLKREKQIKIKNIFNKI
jgi:hypothetical protein